MAKDCLLKAQVPEPLKEAVASASAANFQSESEFVRQSVIARLAALGLQPAVPAKADAA